MNSEFIDAETVLCLCEDIFFELAHENLDDKTKALIEANKQNLFIEIQETISDWLDVLPYSPDPACYLEVKIFLRLPEQKDADLAFILIPADFENCELAGDENDESNEGDEADTDEKKLFHIRWA